MHHERLRLVDERKCLTHKKIFQVKGKHGIVTQKTRALIQKLVANGFAQHKVIPGIRLILGQAGLRVVGNVDRHTVARIVKEGFIASMIQAAEEISSAQTWTGSADGTSAKGVDILVHHAYLRGASPITGKTSEKQLEALITMLSRFVETHNASPLGKADPVSISSLVEKLVGWGSDHAEDQKKFFRLLEAWKKDVVYEARGRASLYTMAEEAPSELLNHVAATVQTAVESIGGVAAWEALSGTEQNTHLTEAERELCKRLGKDVVEAMSPEEHTRLELLVWAGCAMHKEQNAVKGGNERMWEFWETVRTSTPGPAPLLNRDKRAAAASGQVPPVSADDAGGVKLTTLAGNIFNHHDNKKGQQRNYRIFFEHAVGHPVPFPETTQNRFQMHCTAATTLLLHLPHFIQFLELVRDKKDSMTLNNMENNVYTGLTDIPTLTELAVLALYAQSISHPYARVVRGSQHENALLLGGFHHDVVAHCNAITDNPDLLLGPGASHETGSLDGLPWENPEIVTVVHQMQPSLPHLRGVLAAFFTGARDTWIRFSSEFAEGGKITSLNDKQRALAAIPATNCHNESVLGMKRIAGRHSPNMSSVTFNAVHMYAANDTGTWIAQRIEGDPASEAFLRKAARELDKSGLARKEAEALHQAAQEKAEQQRRDKAESERRLAEWNAELDKITPIFDIAYWESARTDRSITLKGFIEPQLRWHNRLSKEVKISGGNKNDKIDRLIAAIITYRTHESTAIPMDIVTSNLQATGISPDDEDDEDLEQVELYSCA
ncbi:hypothetical protein K488DRAFT_66262 [Vararia minispora EC-137]|uniref:Uncharacterized protein n=1 Tax=Vararia minispora EC-137 TaxID=1314806 RepID=A0ACB8Q468_9AGAM|nr:hypothetical protein K488DRAFT_66262 [Vararia minispora EC-137]